MDGEIADVRDRERVREVMSAFKPDVVFHAAALKHVPYLEKNWTEGIKTNVFGSVNVADAAVEAGADAIVMISTDKAIDPVSMLGATKRFAEMYGQALDAEFMGRSGADAAHRRALRQRAGLGRLRGAEIQGADRPRRAGHRDPSRHGALLHDHPRGGRPRAHLRLACGQERPRCCTSGSNGDERASVYVLKMGQPVRIIELAERMIRLAGFEPGEEIEIAVTGTRAGERLHEILFAREEPRAEIGIDGVMAAKPVFADRERVDGWLEILAGPVATNDRQAAERVFEEAIPEFSRRAKSSRASTCQSVSRRTDRLPAEA